MEAGVLQGSILGPLFFLLYIIDLSEKITSTVKHFADDTSLFSAVNDPNISANELNKDLKLISEWAYKWKILTRINKHKKSFSHENSLNQSILNYYLKRHLLFIIPLKSNFR